MSVEDTKNINFVVTYLTLLKDIHVPIGNEQMLPVSLCLTVILKHHHLSGKKFNVSTTFRINLLHQL